MFQSQIFNQMFSCFGNPDIWKLRLIEGNKMDCKDSDFNGRKGLSLREVRIDRKALKNLGINIIFQIISPWTYIKSKSMLENYTIIEKLGEGMYGTVYLVQNPKGQKYALKSVKLNPFTVEESMKEVQATKILTHPNLVKVYDYRTSQETLQILMEYCQKGNLHTCLQSQIFKNNYELSLRTFHQIVDGGVAINRQGVIHRDMKPENIMISQSPKGLILKLGDFGCATQQPDVNVTILLTSFDKGTAIYASPEILNNQVYTSKCDVWSGGCLLYEMYFGEHPFNEDSIDKIKRKIKHFVDDYIFPANCHPRIKYFLKLALQYEESERPSWRELQYQLATLNRYTKQCFEQLLYYLQEIGTIACLINKQIWENRKDTDLNKTTHKAFALYMTGIQYTSHQMIVDLLTGSQQFRDFYADFKKTDVSVYEKTLNKAIKNLEVTRQIYNKIEGHLIQAQGSKKLVEKIPSKRCSFFTHIEYSIKHGKILLEQVFNSSNPQVKVQQNRGYKMLCKWVNFLKWFGIDKRPTIKETEKESVDKMTLSWIKQELSEV